VLAVCATMAASEATEAHSTGPSLIIIGIVRIVLTAAVCI